MNLRIPGLIATHVIALVAAMASANNLVPSPGSLLFLAVVFADAGMLGLWLSLGTTRWRLRSSAVMAALLCFWVALLVIDHRNIRAEDAIGVWLLICLPTAIISLILALLRKSSRRLALQRASTFPLDEGFQFSMKQLLLATALVAAVLSLGKAAQALPHGGRWLGMFVVIAIVPPCLVLVELATFWAALGLGRPLPRLSVVVPCAFIVGLVPPFYFSSPQEPRFFIYWSALTGGQAVIIAASLLVFRWSGWRLCRKGESSDLHSPARQEVSSATVGAA